MLLYLRLLDAQTKMMVEMSCLGCGGLRCVGRVLSCNPYHNTTARITASSDCVTINKVGRSVS